MQYKMLMRKIFLFIALLVAYSASLYSQSICGGVKDKDGLAISFASVMLLEEQDSAVVAGCVTGEDGSFSFESASNGRLLKVACVGYESVFVSAADSVLVVLNPVENLLQDAIITARRPTFKLEKGLFVSKIEGTVYSKLGMATDVLRQLPMMSSEGISVLGRGVPLIYINNRKMRNAAELQRITSDMIKEIKIDLNPGAKYGSDVRAVVHIFTNRPVGEGLGGNLSLMETVSSAWSTDGWLNLNYRKKGLDVFLSGFYNTYSAQHYRRKDSYAFDYEGKDVYAEYDGDGYNSSKNGSTSLGINYQINSKQFVGATYSFSRIFSFNQTQDYQNRMLLADSESFFNTNTHAHSHNGSHNVSAYYENTFSDKLSMNVDATYYHYENYNKQTAVEDREGEVSMLVPVTRSQFDLGALSTKMVADVFKGELECGFEGTYTNFRHDYHLNNDDYTGILEQGDNESRQTAARVFFNYSRGFKNLFTQFGLKYEYTSYDYFSSGTRLKESCKTFHYVLPSVSFSYRLQNLSLMLSYNIYTRRPNYSDLDETIQYISSIRYYRGNSQLKSTYDHNVSLTASYKDFQLVLDYSYYRDASISLFNVMAGMPAILSTDKNFSYPNFYMNLSYSPTFFRIWRPTFNAWLNKQWLTYDGVSYRRPVLGFQWKNMIVLPKDWLMIVNADGKLKGTSNTYTSRLAFTVGMYVQKNMQNCWIRAGVSDLFNTKEKGFSEFANVYTAHRVNYFNPSFHVTFSYSFNVAKSRYKGETAGQSEISRL